MFVKIFRADFLGFVDMQEAEDEKHAFATDNTHLTNIHQECKH